MGAARTRYELRVVTLVSQAALATFRVPLRPTIVPRNTVFRFRVSADRDLSEVLHRLTERDVQVLEIRQCPEPRRRESGTAQVGGEGPRQETTDSAEDADGVVVPFRRAIASRPSEAGPVPDRPTAEGAGHDSSGSAQPDDPVRRTCQRWPTTAPPSNTVLNQVSHDMSTKTTPIGPYRSAFQTIARDR
jgi:hypothetical protein